MAIEVRRYEREEFRGSWLPAGWFVEAEDLITWVDEQEAADEAEARRIGVERLMLHHLTKHHSRVLTCNTVDR